LRGGGVDGVDHQLARGRGGDGGVVDGGQDGGHHPGSLQSVKLDQEEDEEKAHANHPGDGVAGDVEVSGGRDSRRLLSRLQSKLLNLALKLWRSIQGGHLAHRPKRFHRRIFHHLRPMTNEKDSKHRGDHNRKERPVELSVQSSDGGEEAEDDHDHHAGDQVDQDLEAKKLIYFLANIVQVTVDSPQDVQLEDDGGLLLSGDLMVVALHQERWRDVHLGHVHLDRVGDFVVRKLNFVLFTGFPDLIESLAGLLLLDAFPTIGEDFLQHLMTWFLCSEGLEGLGDVAMILFSILYLLHKTMQRWMY